MQRLNFKHLLLGKSRLIRYFSFDSFIVLRIHVRRTDKVGTEAAFHDVPEYMKHVEDYYITYQYQNPNINFTKRVYIATDEPTVFEDARTKYDYLLIDIALFI